MKALLESDGRPSIVHLDDGTRLRVRSREHWLVGPEYLYVVVGMNGHRVPFRNVTSVEDRAHKPSRRRA